MTHTNVNMFQKSEIKSRSNGIFFSFRKDNMSAVVAPMKSVKDVFGIISHAVIVAPDMADLVSWPRRW
jgi:hypothetical protein